jgi:hypothetical protein
VAVRRRRHGHGCFVDFVLLLHFVGWGAGLGKGGRFSGREVHAHVLDKPAPEDPGGISWANVHSPLLPP